MLTFKDIQDQVLLLWDAPGETGNFLTIVKNAINDSHAERCNAQRWSFMLWEDVLTFTTVSGTLNYRLHPLFHRFHRIYNTSDTHKLIEVPPREYYESPETKFHFHMVEPSPVAADLASAGTLSMVSNSASDTTPTLILRLIDNDTASGLVRTGEISEALTANGTSTVTTAASTSKILSVTKGGTWVGTMTLRDADGNTLLTLSPTEYGKVYPQIRLLKDPEQADTVEYRFYRRPRILSADYDIPDIPYPFSRILIWDTLLLLASYDEAKEPGMWVEQRRQWDKKLADNYLEGQALGGRVRQVRDVTMR